MKPCPSDWLNLCRKHPYVTGLVIKHLVKQVRATFKVTGFTKADIDDPIRLGIYLKGTVLPQLIEFLGQFGVHLDAKETTPESEKKAESKGTEPKPTSKQPPFPEPEPSQHAYMPDDQLGALFIIWAKRKAAWIAMHS